MSVAALELNDTGLRVVREGVSSPASPGYALLSRAGVIAGETARAAARLEPLNVSSRFWHELDDRPLPGPIAAGRSNADLAFEHLSEVFRPVLEGLPPTIAAVPGSFQQRQMMLLLGIAREAGLPLAGFIDSAVAAAAAWGGHGRFIYIELLLQEAVLTAVEVGSEARRERAESVPRAGWSAFIDLWMKAIAGRFVARTRFDPLHEAKSEQALFEVLPSWLERLRSEQAIEAQVSVGGETHAVPITLEFLESEANSLYGQILLTAHSLRRAGHATTIGLSDSAARLPGLIGRLSEFHDCDVVVFAPAAAALAAAALDLPWTVQGDDAELVRSAPRLSGESAGQLAPVLVRRAQSTDAPEAATHVLYRGLAHALSNTPLVIGTAGAPEGVNLPIAGASAGISRVHCSLLRTGEGGAMIVDHSRYGTWLNDERVVNRAPLRAGDRLRVGSPGVALDLIAIE